MIRSIINFFRFKNISQKIIFGFLLIYFFFIANALISLMELDKGAKAIREASNVVNPSIEGIENFILMVTQSKSYTISWVHVRTNSSREDKDNLKKIHAEYPEFKDNLGRLLKNWDNRGLVNEMDSVFIQFDSLLRVQKDIMEKLVDFEDYEDNVLKFSAERTLETRVLPISNQILGKLDFIVSEKKKERKSSQTALLESFDYLRSVTIILGSVLIIIGLGVSYWTRRQIVRPIKYINSVFVKLGTGELPEDKHTRFNDDEIGEMAASADKLVYALKATSDFAEKIGKGNYQAVYKPLSEKDVLGNALIEMRNNLSRVAEEEKRRRWETEGLVKFGDLLKEQNNDLNQLSESIVTQLVKYINANQGGLFIIESEEIESANGNGSESYMTMAACYAWDRKKYLEQKIYKGDGLAGQVWQEKATICLNEVPEDYVRITSGLGEANPSSILIVPLKLNEEVFGVIELASFNDFQNFEIVFVEKIAESIASTIASVKINERTKRLLAESTMMTEQMKSQEEEMRQNMEELQATQEHIERSQKEAKEKEELLNFTNLVIETDKKFSITNANELSEIKLGYDLREFEEMAIDYIFESFDKIDSGKSVLDKGNKWNAFTYLKSKNNEKIFVRVSASGIKDEKNNIHKYLFLFDDITDAKS